jgi:hypothetical protein
MRFSDMLTTSEGFELTRALIDALMSAYKDGKGDQVRALPDQRSSNA